MHVATTITTTVILRDQVRPGFGEPFDLVVFTITQPGLDDLGFTIWVHPAYPLDCTEAIARAFLVERLTSMTVAAAKEAMTATEVDALWDTLQPVTLQRRPT